MLAGIRSGWRRDLGSLWIAAGQIGAAWIAKTDPFFAQAVVNKLIKVGVRLFDESSMALMLAASRSATSCDSRAKRSPALTTTVWATTHNLRFDCMPNENYKGHVNCGGLKSSHLSYSSYVKERSRAVAIYFGLQGKTFCNATVTNRLAFMCLSCGWA